MKAHLNHSKYYCPPNELSYAAEDEDEADDDSGDGDVGAGELPAVLTSMVREPETCRTAGESDDTKADLH